MKLTELCNPKQWKTLSSSDLLEDGEYNVYGANGIIGKYNEYNHEEPTVLITCRGATCGNIHMSLPYSYINGNAICLDNVNETICLKEYLYYFLKSIDMKKVISGTAQPQITISGLSKIDVILKPIDIQKNIVKSLKKINILIDNKEKQIFKLDELVKSQFIEMFGDPIANDKKWNTNFLSEVAPSKSYKGEFEDKVWLLNLDMIESNSGRIIDYVYEEKSKVGNSTCTFDENNILYSKLRPYLNKVVVPEMKGYATSELIPLKPNSSVLNKYYLAYLLRSKQFVDYISEKVAGAKMPRVSMDFFRSFQLILPPIELQNKFADIVKQIDKQKIMSEMRCCA